MVVRKYYERKRRIAGKARKVRKKSKKGEKVAKRREQVGVENGGVPDYKRILMASGTSALAVISGTRILRSRHAFQASGARRSTLLSLVCTWSQEEWMRIRSSILTPKANRESHASRRPDSPQTGR
jgi:hypothetical protein